jgi:halimadienyl-diphosphate synthase
MAVSLNGGSCTVYPIEIFEKAWVLYNLGPAAQQIPGAAAHLTYLRESCHAGAIGMSRECLTADSDDTGMVHTLLHRQGEETDLDVLLPFEQESCFSCFPYERNSSVGANTHVLEAFVSSWDRWRYAAPIRKILAYLRSTRLDGAYWYDKWHLSPFYATSQVALATREIDCDLGTSILPWLLETQLADGSWGWFGGTSEETAYAMQALMSGVLPQDSYRRAALDRGARYLSERFDDTDYPELWVGKSLYTPYPIVQAAVIGALQQYQTMLPRR